MKQYIQFIFAFILVLTTGTSLAQKEGGKSTIDFGFVDRFHTRVVESVLQNNSSEDWDLLRWDKENTIDMIVSSRKIAPGDSLILRMKLNPLEEGPYSSQVKLIFGKHEYRINIKANIRYLDLSSNTPCPDFDKVASDQDQNWIATVKVIDKHTRAELSDVSIKLQGMKAEAIDLKTGRNGMVMAALPIDYYNLQVKHAGYATFQLETYINPSQRNILIELVSGGGSVVVRRPGGGVKVNQEEPVKTPEKVIEKPIEPVIAEVKTEFDALEYRLNNITFLIDVSTSMRQGHKMEILRASLSSLVDMLRADDRVSIITYASSTHVLGSGLSGADKDALHTMISELKAEGLTAGEAGLKKAYSQSKKHFIEQGNNQVFLITDGALQKGYDKVVKMADSQAEKNIFLSVIAIDANKWAEQKMKTLADTGRGVYLSVDSEDAAMQELKTSIKEQSRIQP